MEELRIGKITHFFDKIGVGVIVIEEGTLDVGDKIHIKGQATDFEQEIDSMQMQHKNVDKAEAGESIGMKLKEKAKAGDDVFKIIE